MSATHLIGKDRRQRRQQLRIQGDAMRRKGIEENPARRELLRMESAIRSLLSNAALDRC